MELLIESNKTVYDVTQLVTDISYTDKLNNGCSKLDITFQNDNIDIQNGSVVQFQYNKAKIFYGFIFKHSRDKNNKTTVTAYDQLRYCKAKDTIVLLNSTETDLIKRMCAVFGLHTGTIESTGYILPKGVQDSKTWLDIAYYGIIETLKAQNEWYSLRDEFGKIALRNLRNLTTNLIVGDESLCYEYSHAKSIDDDFYNQVKIYVKDEDVKKSKFIAKKSNESIKKYGLLQLYEEVDASSYNITQATDRAESLLNAYNREAETLDLECLGDTSIRAGNSFYANIESLRVKDKRFIVKSVTHKFIPLHTMSLEVSIW